MLVWRCHQPLIMDKDGDNEVKLGAIHRSDIYHTTEANHGKPQLGDSSKAVRPVITTN